MQDNDNDLREALKRKYADTPQLPSDFMANMEKRLQHQPVAEPRKRWCWIAAAACLLFLIGVGVTLVPSSENQTAQEVLIAQQTNRTPQIKKPVVYSEENASTTKPERPVYEASAPKVRRSQRTETEPSPTEQQDTVIEAAKTECNMDPNLHYASAKTKTDSVPYQNPARVDEFITNFANYYKVKEGKLQCSVPKDSNVVSAVYVFPDSKEVDVFSRLLQAACWYSDETPGYFMSFSHRQFFFELKDMHSQLQYRWIAERVNGKILLYSTHAPIGTEMSSTCYQEFRNELLHIRSINTKTREI